MTGGIMHTPVIQTSAIFSIFNLHFLSWYVTPEMLKLGRVTTTPFNNMRTLKFKVQPTNAFFATANQKFGSSSQLPTLLSESWWMIWFDYHALGSSRKLGGVAEHLIDGNEKRICLLIFELKSPHVIERRSEVKVFFLVLVSVFYFS